MIDIVRREFTPPAPIDPYDDPFRVIFETKRFLDGQWRQGRPDYLKIRFGTAVRFQILTDRRMNGIRMKDRGVNQIFGIPIIVDPRMADGVFTITYFPPVGAR